METFSALLSLCVGNSPVTGEFPSQRSVARSFDVFFDLALNKRLSKQSRRQTCQYLIQKATDTFSESEFTDSFERDDNDVDDESSETNAPNMIARTCKNI